MSPAPAPGEIEMEVAGRRLRARLSLAALSRIESALGAEGLSDLPERLRTARASDIAAVAAALLRAGGLEDAEAVAEGLAPRAAAELIRQVFEANRP